MYRAYIKFIFSIYIVLSAGCISVLNLSSSRAFDGEDLLIVSYLDDILKRDYQKASDVLNVLFSKSNKPEYIISKLRVDAIYLDKYQSSMQEVEKYITKYADNKDFLYLAFELSMIKQKYKIATKYAIDILVFDKTQQSYLDVANGYILSQQYSYAIPYLETAYNFNHNERILEKMSTLMYLYDSHKEKALSYLKNHMNLYSFSEIIAQKLLNIYRESNNIEGLISVYKKLNIKIPKKKYSDILIQLYILQDKKAELVEFLMKNIVDLDTFVSLYRYLGNKDYGYKIAMSLYEKSKNINFLGQAGMMEYELSHNKKSQYSIDGAIDKLRKVVAINSSPEYLNYLGYIMIEHDNNLNAGVEYVKKALKLKPQSPYYLDSLAWGYYKLKQYDKAYDVIKKVVEKLGLKDKEVVFHLESIEKAINQNKALKAK